MSKRGRSSRVLAAVLPRRPNIPNKRKVYPPWSPYHPYRSHHYQILFPKGYKRGSAQRKRRDNVWVRKMFEYEGRRQYNDRINAENGY